MFSQKFLQIFIDLNDHISLNMRVLNTDFLHIYDFLIIIYARNVFKYNGEWKKMGRDYHVDYEYINATRCEQDLLNIQARLRFFSRLFKNNITKLNVQLYESYIQTEINTLVTKISYPIQINMQSIRDLVEKYKHLNPKRSDKINYEAIKQLGINVN
jgi:hypothetical protein